MPQSKTPTPGRLAWLRRLADGPAKRGRGSVGYYCMMQGWTEWDYRHPVTGKPISIVDAMAKFGLAWSTTVKLPGNLERLTDAGRKVLRDA